MNKKKILDLYQEAQDCRLKARKHVIALVDHYLASARNVESTERRVIHAQLTGIFDHSARLVLRAADLENQAYALDEESYR